MQTGIFYMILTGEAANADVAAAANDDHDEDAETDEGVSMNAHSVG